MATITVPAIAPPVLFSSSLPQIFCNKQLSINHVSPYFPCSTPKHRSLSLRVTKPCYVIRTASQIIIQKVSTHIHEIQTNPLNSPPLLNHVHNFTRFISTILSSIALVSKIFIDALCKVSTKIPPKPVAKDLQSLRGNLVCAAGPLFFAAVSGTATQNLNTPLTVVAAGMSKWLDMYSGVLMIRVMLSWFPNIPWERQPLCAIRDLCDPYLNLFRNIIPPVFDTLDVSPLLAFSVLGTLGAILHSTAKGSF